MRRRAFIAGLGGAAAWPLAAGAQQQTMPVVGFLRSTPAEPFAHIVGAFRQGLNETGFVEGRNVVIEQRWADNRLDQLPGLAADFVRRHAAVIVGNGAAVEAARSAAANLPIVFVIGGDPVAEGLVTSLNRPGGNLTGLTFFGNRLGAKRLEMLHELVPRTSVIAALIDPNSPDAALESREVEEAGRAIGQKIVPVNAQNEREFDAAFTSIVQATRVREIFRPYHDRIETELDRRRKAGRPAALIAMHSFTPVFKGVARPWHVGVLYNRDTRFAHLLMALLKRKVGLVVGDNEPYSVTDASDYTVPVHGERRGLHHVAIEVRHDLIADEKGQRTWGLLLARLLPQVYQELVAA